MSEAQRRLLRSAQFGVLRSHLAKNTLRVCIREGWVEEVVADRHTFIVLTDKGAKALGCSEYGLVQTTHPTIPVGSLKRNPQPYGTFAKKIDGITLYYSQRQKDPKENPVVHVKSRDYLRDELGLGYCHVEQRLRPMDDFDLTRGKHTALYCRECQKC